MIIKGYAAHFSRPNKNLERVTREAFDKSIEEFNRKNLSIPINIDHNNEKIVGKVLSMKTDSTGLYITAEIFDNIPEAQKIAELIENGLFNYFSTEGYIREKDVKKNQDGTYTVSRFRLTAIAIVNQPADVKAVLSVASFIDKEEEKLLYLNNEFETETLRKISIYDLM